MLEFVALVSLLRRLSNQGVRRQRILCFCCVEKADPPPGSSTTCCGSLPTSASPPRSPSTCCGSRRGPTWRTRLRGTTLWTAGALTTRPGQRSPGIQCMSPLPSLVDSSSFGNRSLLVQPRCSARVFITLSRAATEDHAINQRSGDRPCQAHIAARTPEPSTERKCRAPGVRVSPNDAETRSHGRDVRSRGENGESQPGGHEKRKTKKTTKTQKEQI